MPVSGETAVQILTSLTAALRHQGEISAGIELVDKLLRGDDVLVQTQFWLEMLIDADVVSQGAFRNTGILRACAASP